MDPVDWITLFFSALALVISGLSAAYTRRQANAEQRVARLAEAEQARKRFDLRLDDIFKNDWPTSSPCVWGVRFIASNQSSEPVFVRKVVTTLIYRSLMPIDSIRRMISFLLRPPQLTIDLVVNSFASGAVDGDLPLFLAESEDWQGMVDHSTYLVNWESKQAILSSESHWHRGPAPGDKEAWVLVGIVPPRLAATLAKHELHLAEIKCDFHTDQGLVSFSRSYPTHQGLPRDIVSTYEDTLEGITTDLRPYQESDA